MKNLRKMKNFTLALILAMITSLGFSQAQWNYVSPKPGSKFINPENTIAVRHGDVIDQTTIKAELFDVSASKSGKIKGEVKLSRDGRTLIFEPSKPFIYNEKIQVKLIVGVKTEGGLELPELTFDFQVTPFDNTEMLNDYYQIEYEKEIASEFKENNNKRKPGIKNTNNLPERFPPANVTEFDSPTAGSIFCAPRPNGAAPYDPYSVIMDNYGTPVYYRQWPRRNNDFKLLVNNQLTFCDFDNGNVAVNKYLLMDSHFNITDTLLMGNGYHIDQHDILMDEDGNHFLMAYDPQIVNMDTVVPGGNPEATVTGFVVQQLDADHNVIFQWRSWDHFEITDANHTDFLSDRIDYAHGNAFEIDHDGNLLMSLRNMEEITKIDLNTGEIIWRFGLKAKNNMFTFLNDTIGFSWQHDVRRLDNGNVTVYDNGNYHLPEPFSQAVEYQLDEENFTAELVWNYLHDPVIYGRATGAHRRLENNNAFICWGLTWPMNYSEVTHDGNLAWDFGWTEEVWDYRAFKFDWTTDYFEPSQDSVDFGVYDDYVAWPKIILITNNSDNTMEITSTHNFLDCYEVVTPLPLEIPAGETVNFQFNLDPTVEEGHLDDVLTLNYDSFFSDTLHQRISRQIFLTAYVEDNNPPVASTNPGDGALDVDRSIQPEIAFNESLTHADGTVLKSADLKNFILFKEENMEGADVAYTASIDAWKKTITILPTEILASGKQYYIEIPANVVADREGHALTEMVSTTFTTFDDQAPTVVINPADSTTGAYVNQMITFSFDEQVMNIDGTEITNNQILDLFVFNHNDEAGESVAFYGLINDEKNQVTIQSLDNLTSYQYYYVALIPDMLKDAAGNIVSDLHQSHFETGEEVGISEFENLNILINPNPTQGQVTLSFDTKIDKLIEVFDISGKRIINMNSNSTQASIDLSKYNDGIYLLTVKFENGNTGFVKVIKN